MTHKALSIAVLVLLSLASRVSAAPIELVAELDPGQLGPVYSWSLSLRTEPGYNVGAITVVTTGFDSFVFNPALTPPISVLDSAFISFPGFEVLLVASVGSGVALAPPLQTVLLGHFLSAFNTTAGVTFTDCELDCGGTAYDAVEFFPYDRVLIDLRLVPEPSHFAILAVALLALALCANRSRPRMEGDPR